MSEEYINKLDHSTVRLMHTACLEYQLKMLHNANKVRDEQARINLHGHVRKLGKIVETLEKRLETLEVEELKRTYRHPLDSAESLFTYNPSSV